MGLSELYVYIYVKKKLIIITQQEIAPCISHSGWAFPVWGVGMVRNHPGRSCALEEREYSDVTQNGRVSEVPESQEHFLKLTIHYSFFQTIH